MPIVLNIVNHLRSCFKTPKLWRHTERIRRLNTSKNRSSYLKSNMPEVNTDFKAACDFFKAQVNKAFTLNYEQKILISALFNQAKHGPFTPDKAPDVGPLDFVGKARRAKWASLGNMSKAEAEDTFVQTLITICPRFAAHLEAVSAVPVFGVGTGDPPESSRLPPPTAHSPPSPVFSDTEPKQTTNGSLKPPLSHSQEFHIRAALNAQTLTQFQAYAAQQHPDDQVKQMKLISQLQDRHFHQYMEYLAQTHARKSAQESLPEDHHSSPQPREQQLTSADVNPAPSTETAASGEPVAAAAASQVECPPPQASAPPAEHAVAPSAEVPEHREDGDADMPKDRVNGEADPASNGSTLAPAQMWTRPDIVEFKALLSQDAESVVNVGSGELVTIRVPVVPSGNFIVWEFATDNYDIGFGLFFEWVKPSSPAPGGKASWKIMEGSSQPLDASSPPPDQSQTPCKVVVEEVIPIYRRSSNTEVYCGSHAYPGNGTYLLKFDNTYSLWRSKMLYYRVYSTK